MLTFKLGRRKRAVELWTGGAEEGLPFDRILPRLLKPDLISTVDWDEITNPDQNV
ncbi:MAG: hypothetical protein Q3M24_13155 [Candidatus Electrothrix aestuarii]|uniref:Uncharacterized protein n=1 Tax=Candidatus Electrothrix aestuarii TaxID=3062594 RepID=A0AAU8LQZ9_9BACT|nr:hypothetical protein [Candidatus Electrothrix aestuarii]